MDSTKTILVFNITTCRQQPMRSCTGFLSFHLFLLSPRFLGTRWCGANFDLLSLELIPLMEVQSVDLPGVLPLDGQHELHHLVTLHPPVYQHEDVLRYNKPKQERFIMVYSYFNSIRLSNLSWSAADMSSCIVGPLYSMLLKLNASGSSRSPSFFSPFPKVSLTKVRNCCGGRVGS